MGTSYLEIYDRFLRKITDFNLPQLDESDLQLECRGYMDSAIAKLKKCQSDLSKRDDLLLCFEEELLDVEKEILALQMVCEWVEPQVNSTLLLSQMVGWKEDKFFAQANQISALEALRDSAEERARALRRDWSYQNSSYLNS